MAHLVRRYHVHVPCCDEGAVSMKVFAAFQFFCALCFVSIGLMALADLGVHHGLMPRVAYGVVGIFIGWLAAMRP